MKNVIITGASGNLGKAAVEKFVREKYKVITTVTPGRPLGFEVDREVETYEADLTDESSAGRFVEAIIAKHKTIDAALLLVGGFAPGGIDITDGTLLNKMFTLNFNTAYYVARPVFQHMLNQSNGGRIIFVGARPGLEAGAAKTSLAYGLSKSLIFNLANVLNAMAAHKNVTASVVVPSTIDTTINRQAMPSADFKTWVKPEEIADAMAYICSDEASAWRGTVLKLYGNA